MNVVNWEVEGYRSISQGQLSPTEFNVLVGRNNTGKSSVIQSFCDIAADLPNPSVDSSNSFSSPDWENIITKDTESDKVHLHLEFSLDSQDKEYILEQLSEKHVGESYLEWAQNNEAFSTIEYDFHFDTNGHSYIWTTYTSDEAPVILHNGQQGENMFINQLPPEDLNNSGSRTKVYPIFRDAVTRSMATWKLAGSFRKPRNIQPAARSDTILESGENLVQVLDTMARNFPSQFQKVQDTYIEIMEGVTGIRTPFVHDNGDNTTIMVDERGHSEGFSLKDISAGSKEILTLITLIVKAEQNADLLMVEEPELHLHPGAQHSIYDLLKDVSEGSGPQVIISTHSKVFLDETDSSNIISVSRDVTTELGTVSQDIGQLLGPEGEEKSDVIQSRAVAFVEGVSDMSVLQVFSETLASASNRGSFDDLGVVLRPLGGDRMKKHGAELHDSFSQLRIPHLFIVDSDDQIPDEKNNNLQPELGGAELRVLNEYSIESYLLKNPYAIADPFSLDIDEVTEYIQDADERPNKKSVLNDLMKDLAGREGGYDEREHAWTIARNVRAEDVPAELDELIARIEGLPK